ncbi:glycosyl transferase [Thioclava dalianensis]|uniref:Glycosyl transferase n=1 Tax=Thioclava dalianensis TaxID=1185766 RepID=A0A074T929_9RHOB|nr:glycosyltransferase family 39 protein [Thioclava dalianensis]KEP68214.1 glycosyl transferase [Thioclava dalianensis]SFN86832.1 Dolichyl-phosphate-mannose-protein mannosyltransferase [Thioclava dalianensis]
MPSVAAKADHQGWFGPACAVVLALTALRIVALAFDRTDLFVDETQYWLWGQHLDFGYYSKPPLIGWLIRAVTALAGSDAPFWVRLPGSVLHGLTALVLGALGARIGGARVGLWTAVIYVTLPFVAVGSVLISTDTVMAPFYALALLFAHRTAQSRGAGEALLAGLFAGCAFMAKYAAIYLIPGLALAALVAPSWRIGWRNTLLMVLAFGVAISPNVIWNITHDLTTVSHTMDNVGWVRTGALFNLPSMGTFLGSQFAVFGPLTFAALLVGYLGWRNEARRGLVMLSIPALVAVTIEALLDRAYANWAIAAYFAGTVLAVLVMGRIWRWGALGINLIIAVAIPVLTITAPWPAPDGKSLLKRWLGRVDLSETILALAKADDVPVYTANRDILADLFYTGRDAGVRVYAPDSKGRPQSYYEEMWPLPAEYSGKLLVIARQAPECGAGPVAPAGDLKPKGTWVGKGFAPYLVEARCVRTQE